MKSIALLALILGTAMAEVFFQEKFDSGKFTPINNLPEYVDLTTCISDDWESKWVSSTHKGGDAGKFVWTAGKFYGDADKDKGIQTSQDAKFYALSSEFKPFSNKDKPVVIQFTVKHEQNIDCGGGYAKIFDCSLDQSDMHGESPYHIMFGESQNRTK